MNNKLSIYYAFLDPLDEVDWISSLSRAKAAGLDGLEMSAPKLRALSAQQRDAIAGKAAQLGLCLTFATALAPGEDTASEDPFVCTAGVKRLKDDIHMVSDMGGTALGGILTGVGKHFPPGIEKRRDETAARAAAALAAAADTAYGCGVSLCLEVVNRFESPLINTCAEGLRAIEKIQSPALGLLLDTFHMNIEEASPTAAIAAAGKRLAHFHACENNRALPGHGHIDWEGTLKALHGIGYTGIIAMEALPGPHGSLPSRMNIWRKLSQDVDKELFETVSFLREKMEAI